MSQALVDNLALLPWDLAKIALGGVLASFITLYINGRRQDRELHRAASNIAGQLIAQFEGYAIACVKVPAQNAEGRRGCQDPYDGSGLSSLPEFPDLPQDDAGWRALPLGLAIDCRTFTARVGLSQDAVSSLADHGDADDVHQEMDKQALILTLGAWRLAADLRERFAIAKGNAGWPIEEESRRRLEEIQAREAEWWAQNGRTFESISDPVATQKAETTNLSDVES